MADYRGGDSGRSGASQSAVHNIMTGNTPGERARQLRQKLIQGGVEAGLTGLAGYIKGEVGKDEENAGKRKIMADAIANAKKASAKQQAGFAEVRNKYPGGAEGPQSVENYGYTPKGGFQGAYQGYGSKSPEEAGKQGLQQDDINKTAAGAPVTWGSSKQYTPAGMEDHAGNAEIAGGDDSYLKGLSNDQVSTVREMRAKERALIDMGPSVGGPGSARSFGTPEAGGDITRENPYNVPSGSSISPEAADRSYTGWAPNDEELSGMGQTKRGM